MQRERRYENDRLNKAAKELWAYKAKQRQIEDLTDKLAEYQERYSAIEAMRYDKICVKGGDYHDRLVDVAIKWADLDIEIKRKMVELEHDLWTITQKLNLLTAMQSKVLELYYIKGYDIVKIAEMTNYSDVQIKRIKAYALDKIATY